MSCQIAKTEYWKIMIWLSDTKCCHLAIHYVLPKDQPGPNLHFRFMKNCIYTSLLGSLAPTFKKPGTSADFEKNRGTVHNGLKTGIKRTATFWFASAVKTLSDSIFPCFLQLKHSIWQILINFIFLSLFQNFISFWWVHVQFRLQG